MLNLQGKRIIYISELDSITLEEECLVELHEGNKVYTLDSYGNKDIFNLETGYCYSYNPTFGAKKYLKLNT